MLTEAIASELAQLLSELRAAKKTRKAEAAAWRETIKALEERIEEITSIIERGPIDREEE